MTKQFNVGDTVKYTSPFNDTSETGVIVEVNLEYFEIANGKYRTGYLIRWTEGNQYWIADGNLSLLTLEVTIKSAKELKAELESEILRLIQDFNKKTDLQIKDVDLDCYNRIGEDCYYRVNVKVEI